jgi:hypothetical protein
MNIYSCSLKVPCRIFYRFLWYALRLIQTHPDTSSSHTNVSVVHARFEILTAMRATMLFFWVVTPCRPGAKDGDSMFIRKVYIYLGVYKVLQPRRTTSSFQWSLQITVII